MLCLNILFRKHFMRWKCFRLCIHESLSKIGCKWMGTKRELFPVASHHQITLYSMQTMTNVESIFLQSANSCKKLFILTFAEKWHKLCFLSGYHDKSHSPISICIDLTWMKNIYYRLIWICSNWLPKNHLDPAQYTGQLICNHNYGNAYIWEKLWCCFISKTCFG